MPEITMEKWRNNSTPAGQTLILLGLSTQRQKLIWKEMRLLPWHVLNRVDNIFDNFKCQTDNKLFITAFCEKKYPFKMKAKKLLILTYLIGQPKGRCVSC